MLRPAKYRNRERAGDFQQAFGEMVNVISRSGKNRRERQRVDSHETFGGGRKTGIGAPGRGYGMVMLAWVCAHGEAMLAVLKVNLFSLAPERREQLRADE